MNQTFPISTIFKEALPTIEKYAPTLGSFFGGAPGIALSIVVPLLAKAFNTEAMNFSDLISRIMKDEAAPLKLQSLEDEHYDWLCSLLNSVNKLKSAEIVIKLDWNKI